MFTNFQMRFSRNYIFFTILPKAFLFIERLAWNFEYNIFTAVTTKVRICFSKFFSKNSGKNNIFGGILAYFVYLFSKIKKKKFFKNLKNQIRNFVHQHLLYNCAKFRVVTISQKKSLRDLKIALILPTEIQDGGVAIATMRLEKIFFMFFI